ncbi:hypothetical protein [Natrialba swarupiae]|uniref:Uncharacterized protein n=1 Tax=Natrialba swarupiae TaxID=2448032 RepID=A0A5D5AGD5_9EURY|nr:hypothetical protein [Natrialba swarupiae]MCW8172725.1 hypothetical protein [Natrialba swarupiae]TYT60859.1 hypothetical protein FYC77_16665 [Natrialba swarupiae]
MKSNTTGANDESNSNYATKVNIEIRCPDCETPNNVDATITRDGAVTVGSYLCGFNSYRDGCGEDIFVEPFHMEMTQSVIEGVDA